MERLETSISSNALIQPRTPLVRGGSGATCNFHSAEIMKKSRGEYPGDTLALFIHHSTSQNVDISVAFAQFKRRSKPLGPPLIWRRVQRVANETCHFPPSGTDRSLISSTHVEVRWPQKPEERANPAGISRPVLRRRFSRQEVKEHEGLEPGLKVPL